jgi:hypothetical protein
LVRYIDSNREKSYLKVVVRFDSTATLQEVIDAWTLGPGQTGPDQFVTNLNGFLNSQYDSPSVIKQRSIISQRSDGKFEVYEKVFYTGTPKGSVTDQEFVDGKDSSLNALKGVYNEKFQTPPVQYTNVDFHIHKSWNEVNEPFGVQILPSFADVDAVLV